MTEINIPPPEEKRSLFQRANDNLTERLVHLATRMDLDPNDNGTRKQLAMTVGVIGGMATLFLAPEIAGNVIHTVQSHGANYIHPGMGEIIGVELAAGAAGYKLGPKLAGK